MVALLPLHIPDKVPLFDAAIFADTGEEPQAVYDHLHWLIKVLPYPVLVRTAGRLGDDLVAGIGDPDNYAQIPAWLAPDGIAPRHCTAFYKIDVLRRCIRQELLLIPKFKQVPPGTSVVTSTGLSFEEQRRIAKVNAHATSWHTYNHPLSDLQITRSAAQHWLRDKVPHTVPRSACVFCPFHSNAQFADLKANDPEGWHRAVEIDEKLRSGAANTAKMNRSAFIHRSRVPLAKADLTVKRPKQPTFDFADECHGMCGV